MHKSPGRLVEFDDELQVKLDHPSSPDHTCAPDTKGTDVPNTEVKLKLMAPCAWSTTTVATRTTDHQEAISICFRRYSDVCSHFVDVGCFVGSRVFGLL